MEEVWLTSSPSAPEIPGSLLARFSAARERFDALSTTSRCSTAIHSSSTSEDLGGSVSSLYDAIERAIGYGIEPPVPAEGQDRPPLVTYEKTPGPHGDVYSATDAYVSWFRRTYCPEGGEDRVRIARASPPAEAAGGGDTGAVASRRRWAQRDLMG